MKLYFAHPVSVYDTPLEGAVVRLISHHFPGAEVVNPNTPEFQRMYEEAKAASGGTHGDHKGMDIFYKLLDTLDGCVAMPFLDWRIGLGVAGEMQKTLRVKKPVWLVEPVLRLNPQELDAFVANPLGGLFVIRCFGETMATTLRDHPGDLKNDPPSFVVGHEETRLRTFFQYNGQKRPYAEAHKVTMPPPPDFYALDPKKK